MNVKGKLEYFLKIAKTEAEEEKIRIEKEINYKYNKAYTKATKEAKQKYDEKIISETYKIEQLKNREIIAAQTEAKRGLINLRNELLNELFIKIESNLKTFVSSEQYESYLLEHIKAEAQNYHNVKVLLNSNDMKYSVKITNELNIPVEESKYGFIGGFKLMLPDKNAIIDKSFDEKLAEQRENFDMFRIKREGL